MSDNANASSWKNPAVWGRVVFVLLFLLLFALIVGPLAIILAVVQALFTIFTGEDNRNLRGLAAALAEYIHEILQFATWNREQKPFPFAAFPKLAQAEQAAATESESEASPAEEKKPARRTTRKKTSTRKAAADKAEG